jgi:nicotinamide-nucleotide amidase
MHAEIIAIGSELTTGAKLDTNSQWLSQELASLGIPVHFHVTVADDVKSILGVLETATARSDVVLITGGLGPTLDDLTRQAVADLLQVELVLHEPSLEFIKSLFARMGRTMPERNVIQAMFPVGSKPLHNPRGTAPGLWLELLRPGKETPCIVAAMPGVPSEMKQMFHNEIAPQLPVGGRVIKQARLNCFGLGESAAEEMLGELTARGRNPEVGITVHEATITLRITAHAPTAETCDVQINATKRLIREIMNEYVFAEEDDGLEHVVVRLLNERGLTLATAESGTGGLLADRLTNVAGFEKCFLGGAVVPTAAVTESLLDVDSAALTGDGPTSAAVASQMATGCRKRFGAHFALSITDCPRWDREESNEPAPTAYIALSDGDGVEIFEHRVYGDPAIAKSRVAKAALYALRRRLLH